MSQLARVPTFKMVIIGDSGVGKVRVVCEVD